MRALEGKVALITGASIPRGIGLAAAGKLAEAGATLVVADLVRNKQERDRLKQAVSALEAMDSEAIGIEVDVTDESSVGSCVKQTLACFGRIDVLVNNAGSPAAVGPFLEIPVSEWQTSWQVNLMGAVHFCRAVIPHMKKNGGGSIINNASLAGLGGVANYTGYCTTKHAVVGFTKALAAEFGPDNIRANAICPGIIDTRMNDQQIKMIAERNNCSLEQAENILTSEVSMKRAADPSEVGDVVAFLASDASSYITGTAIPIAGGLASGV